jgi:HEAT repeat protein
MTPLPGYNQSSPTIGAWMIAGLCLFAGADSAVAQTHSSGGPTPSLEEQERPEAADEPTITEQIVWTFSGYHASTQPETLLEFGSRQEVVAALKVVASDAQMRPSIRLRAVDALGRIGGDQATAFLETLLETPEGEETSKARRVSELLRMHAISGLGRALEDAAAAQRLEALWDGSDVQTRLTIVEALGSHAGSPGREALGRLVERADEQLIKEKIGAQLSR